MYPPVKQFETRDLELALLLANERHAAHARPKKDRVYRLLKTTFRRRTRRPQLEPAPGGSRT
jgi:hypothetical protein